MSGMGWSLAQPANNVVEIAAAKKLVLTYLFSLFNYD